MGVSTPIGFFVFDKEAALRTQAMAGSAVTVGIRPQNIARADHYAARRYSDTMVTLNVELVQSLGDRSLVVGRGKTIPSSAFWSRAKTISGPASACRCLLTDARYIFSTPAADEFVFKVKRYAAHTRERPVIT